MLEERLKSLIDNVPGKIGFSDLQIFDENTGKANGRVLRRNRG